MQQGPVQEGCCSLVDASRLKVPLLVHFKLFSGYPCWPIFLDQGMYRIAIDLVQGNALRLKESGREIARFKLNFMTPSQVRQFYEI